MPNMSDLTLNQFKQRIGLGTRANRFDVDMKIPGVNFVLNAEVTAVALPSADINPIRIPFRGRTLKVPGDRRYPSWSFTVYDPHPSKSSIWGYLHDWSNRINNHYSNVTRWNPDTENNGAGVVDWEIHHHDLNGGSPIKSIKLHNCWPTSVGAIALSHAMSDQLVTFNVEVEFEYFTYNYA